MLYLLNLTLNSKILRATIKEGNFFCGSISIPDFSLVYQVLSHRIIIPFTVFETTYKSKEKVVISQMLYCICDASKPAEYLTCGNLVSENGFVHLHRTLDFFVLILVQEGTLHICQDGRAYDISPGEFFVLFPGSTHYGYKPTRGYLSYCWTHFTLPDSPADSIKNLSPFGKDHFRTEDGCLFDPFSAEMIFLPEHGKILPEKRSQLLFLQLLDLAKRSSYQMTRSCCHALNLLLLEISREYLLAEHFGQELLPTSVQDITEWIQSHFDQPLTVRGLAEKFGYHPTYLSALIKQYTGYPLVTYINRTRISVSKNLLNSHSLTIRQISSMCGFTDEKHFMKLFRQFEGMTPTQYRKAFDQKKINTL